MNHATFSSLAKRYNIKKFKYEFRTKSRAMEALLQHSMFNRAWFTLGLYEWKNREGDPKASFQKCYTVTEGIVAQLRHCNFPDLVNPTSISFPEYYLDTLFWDSKLLFWLAEKSDYAGGITDLTYPAYLDFSHYRALNGLGYPDYWDDLEQRLSRNPAYKLFQQTHSNYKKLIEIKDKRFGRQHIRVIDSLVECYAARKTDEVYTDGATYDGGGDCNSIFFDFRLAAILIKCYSEYAAKLSFVSELFALPK